MVEFKNNIVPGNKKKQCALLPASAVASCHVFWFSNSLHSDAIRPFDMYKLYSSKEIKFVVIKTNLLFC